MSIANIATKVTGPRSKWIILLIWVIAVLVCAPLQGLLSERSTNDSANFLPEKADSTRVATLLRDETIFASGENIPAIIVFKSKNDQAITPREQAKIGEWVGELRAQTSNLPANAEVAPGAPRSDDGSLLLTFINFKSPTNAELRNATKYLRAETARLNLKNVTPYVTGPAALANDIGEAFSGVDLKLVIGTSGLVLLLLLLIYRSPLIALVPLLSVALAAMLARALLGVIIPIFDLAISGQTSGIMMILIFGAGTDYCLLIVARYREELHRHRNAHHAMRKTVRHTTPAILSSGFTVILTMIVLVAADLRSTSSLGPALIVGICFAMLAGLTLLPALLLMIGRRAFWPFIPRYSDSTNAALNDRVRGWRRLAGSIEKQPKRWFIAILIITAAMSSGYFTQTNQPTSELDLFLSKPESVRGFENMQRKLSPGELAKSTVLIGVDKATPQEAQRELTTKIEERLNSHPMIAGANIAERGSDKNTKWQEISFSFAGNPYEQRAVETIVQLRSDFAKLTDKNTEILIGGPTAETADTQTANAHDLRIIIPGVLLVIMLVLTLLLRALVAPAVLVITVVLGYLATLGVSYPLLLGALKHPGIEDGTLTFIFLFTAALGIDYNIFLVARIREQVDHGATTRTAISEALETTGGVITSAGIILAGTFMILAALPFLPLRQLGIAVAIGILLDTFLIRAMLVPALLTMIGESSWWPRQPRSKNLR